jgi:spore coat-associated protein N
MSRLQVLVSQPRLALGALLSLALASAVVVGSGADFTASSANPANTFSSGTLAISNSSPNAAVFTASNLRPGGASQSGTVDIGNSGTLSGVFKLSRGTIADSGSTSNLSPKLNMAIVDCGTFTSGTPTCGDGDDSSVYTGPLPGIGTSAAPIGLGTFNGGEKHRYKFTVSLDPLADNSYQGGTSTVDFNWTAG